MYSKQIRNSFKGVLTLKSFVARIDDIHNYTMRATVHVLIEQEE